MEREDSATALLIAARDLFAEKGYNVVTTKEIAKKAGVNEVTLFRNFHSKQNLLEAVLERFCYMPDFQSMVDAHKDDPYIFLMEIGKALVHMFNVNMPIMKMGLQHINVFEVHEKSDVPFKHFPNQVKNLIQEYLKKYYKEISPEQVENIAVVFVISVSGLFFNISYVKTFDPTPDFDRCLDMVASSLLLKINLDSVKI